jgi:hypothetical protein
LIVIAEEQNEAELLEPICHGALSENSHFFTCFSA